MVDLGRPVHVLAAAAVCGLSALSCSSILGLDEFEDAGTSSTTTGGAGGDPGAGGGPGTGAVSSGGTGGGTSGPGGGTGGEGGGTGGEGGGTGGEGGSFCAPLVDTQPCYSGPDGTLGKGICVEGTATCLADGTAFGPCEGEVVPEAIDNCATGDDENCDDQPNDGCPCAPDEIASCYTGPARTLGVGACTGGTQQCDASGTEFGPCTGDVTPAAETCSTTVDDDCDGAINEEGAGCVCTPNAVEPCYTGPAGTLDVGLCVAGTHQCNDQGTAFGACGGEVLPVTESCLLVGDENCDGSSCSEADWALGAGNSSNQRGVDIAGDAEGNTYAVGSFAGTINLGGGTLTSAGGSDIWVAKFSPSGVHLWSKRFGSTGSEGVLGLAVSSAGDVALTGSFGGTLNLGGGTLTSLGGSDIFVAKLDTAGNHLWSKRFGDANSQYGKDVTISPNGNVTVFGEYYGQFNFGGANIASSPAPAQGLFVAQLASSTGDHVWSRGLTPGFGYARSLSVDGSGNVYTAGGFAGTANAGCGSQATTGGGYDAWVARYAGTTGACTWSKLFTGDDTATTEVIDVEGTSLFVSGEFQGSLAVGTVSLNALGANTDDIFLARLGTSDGSTTWAKRIGDSNDDAPGGVAAAPGGGVHVGGNFTGTINLGGADHVAAGLDDVFLARFDSAGVLLWSKSAGDGATQALRRIGRDGQLNLLGTGLNTGVIDFGGLPVATVGGEDVFLVKVGH